MTEVPVLIEATDALADEGLSSLLTGHPEITLRAPEEQAAADVTVMGIERLTPRAVARLRMHAAVAGRPAILVISAIDEAELVLLAECLVVAVLGRGSVNSVSGLTLREIEVLRLTAEGLGTVEIAKETHCSERTVKNIVHGAVSRYQLRNRTHAVAYAMRRTHLSATDRRGHCRRPDGEPGQHNLVSSSQAARNSTRKEQRCRIAAPGT